MRRGEWNLQSDDLLDDPEYGAKRGPLARVPYANTLTPRTQWIALGSAIIFFLVILLVIVTSLATTHVNDKGTYTNVIIMISDGFGPASETMARVALAVENDPSLNKNSIYPATGPLTLDKFLVGTVRTYSSDSYVTDSAAGATAYSCALKTNNYGIAVDDQGRACGHLFEAAKTKGLATGIVATSETTHATPAAFSSHANNRNMTDYIATQQINSGLDVIFGGGSRFYDQRKDSRNLFNEAGKMGYTVTRNLKEWEMASTLPLLSLFAPGHMNYEIDRDPTQQPSLAEMTSKAIELLHAKPNTKGFILMVEGSRIDHAGHTNDPSTHYREILAYQKAVDVATSFAEKEGNTIVISTSDHETGGLTLGNGRYAWYPNILIQAKASAEATASKFRATNADVRALFLEYYGYQLDDEQVAAITSTFSSVEYRTAIAIAHVISEFANIGWTTLAHTGVDINLYAYGRETDKLRGNHENTDVGKFVEKILNLNLDAETKKLKNFPTVGK